MPPSENFGSTTTNANGQYTAQNSFGPVVSTDITIMASLPDFPEAGETVCSLNFNDSGPHSSASSFYFCSDLSSG